MLPVEHISKIQIYSEEWHKFRIGKFTSSKIHNLMAEKPYSDGFMTYVEQKACEFINGQTLAEEDEQIEDEYTVWGQEWEPYALQAFGQAKGLKYLVTQKLISAPGGRFSSTPDALWILQSSLIKENHYNVATVEVKCPRKYPRFLKLWRCNTPEDVKKAARPYYWQVLDQMDNCNAVLGYFSCFHPHFPEGKRQKIVEFNKLDLWKDFSLLQQRKKLAIDEFMKIVSEFGI